MIFAWLDCRERRLTPQETVEGVFFSLDGEIKKANQPVRSTAVENIDEARKYGPRTTG